MNNRNEYLEKYQHAVSIVRKLKENSYEAYFVGGWVRDYLLGIQSEDIDLATNCPIEVIPKLFPECNLVGMAFGIAIVRVDKKYQFEIATFRLEADYKDGRHPETVTQPTTAKKDAQRRDFTINALFYDPLKDKIIDFVGGQEDLNKRIIRAVGNPYERFKEDKLRMMRAARFITMFPTFTIEEKTKKTIQEMASELLPATSIERVWQEIEKVNEKSHQEIWGLDDYLLNLYELKLFSVIFPDLKAMKRRESKEKLKTINYLRPNIPTIAKISALFIDYPPEKLLELCDYFKLPKKDKNFIKLFIKGWKMVVNSIVNGRDQIKDWVPWVQFYADSESNKVLEMIALFFYQQKIKFLEWHIQTQQKFQKQIERIKNNNPVLKAEHLEAEGIEPSEKLGLLLKEGERIAINQNLEEPWQIIRELKKKWVMS